MAKKKTGPGRPKDTNKKVTEYVYLRPTEKQKILKKHKTLTIAILQECG